MDIANLGVQILIFLGLIWYAFETRKIRKASHKQIDTSHKQIDISQEQNETMQKPCLVPSVKQRANSSVNQDVLKDRRYPDERVINPDVAGNVRLCNIGNGPAFNVHYEAQIQKRDVCLTGALPYIPKGGTESIGLSASISNGLGNVRLKLSYESLSGQSYESEMSVKEWDAVVSDWQFRSCPSR